MANDAKAPEGMDLSGDASALVPPTRQTGEETATGQALLGNSTDAVPQGEDRGSKLEIAGGEPASDWAIANGEGDATIGAQSQPARFTSNGQLPHNMIPTPSGAVPVGATSMSPEDAQRAVQDVNDAHDAYVNRGTDRRKLTPQTVQRLSIPDIQAIAQQRGYDIPEFGGVRVMRAAYLRAQDQDKNLTGTEAKLNQTNAGGAVGASQPGELSPKARDASAQASGAGAKGTGTPNKPAAKA